MGQQCEDAFVPILPQKEGLRGIIEKKQKEALTLLQNMSTHRVDTRDTKQSWPLLPQTVARLNKDFKISLLHCYCVKICKSNLINADRMSAIESADRLKTLMNVFPSDFQVMQLQSTEFKQYMFAHSHFSEKQTDFLDDYLFANLEEGHLNSLFTIPSIKSLFQTDSLTYKDKETFDRSVFEATASALAFDTKHLERN
jgi:hypothetical protein